MAPSKKKQQNCSSSSKSSKRTSCSVTKYHCSTRNVLFTSMSTFLNHMTVNKYKKCLENYKFKCKCCRKPFGRSSELSRNCSIQLPQSKRQRSQAIFLIRFSCHPSSCIIYETCVRGKV